MTVANNKKWREWEDDYIAATAPNFSENLLMMEQMYIHARPFLNKNSFSIQDIENKILLAKRINVSIPSKNNRSIIG